ncbi:ubiquitin specific protease 47 isoform 1 [Reticulomyxa filosa]|uniref:Ubiquitin specific protease 47 isoform 1 n=1 Tax=Reticulomyxa filosa TaxID=46433 RepID=X6N7X2_RETFI|nr:ubiquitin specific protease 47 isoform 1 [Reticulomyxa filosa]|eukprot:ETO22018.1 ubiquitin specific protease 47 isoform 1 [Reticulomyxa filosa]
MGGVDVSGTLADSLKKKEDTRKRFENAKPSSDAPTSGQSATSTSTSTATSTTTTAAETTPAKPSFINPQKAAYMLIYRLKDTSKNINRVPKDLISPELIEEIRKEDEIYARQKEEFEKVKDLLNLAVHYKGDLHEIHANKNITLGQAHQLIFDKLREKLQIDSLECMRLRKMKVVPRPIPVEPLTSDLFEQTLQQLRFGEVENLWLETRKPDETFPKYEPSMMEIRMVELDAERMEYKPELILLGLTEAKQLRIVFQAQETATLWINDNLKLKGDQRLRPGDTIHVERCENHLSGESTLLKKFDEMLNVITIRYNKLLKEKEEVKFDQFVSFDVRKSLGELKTILSKNLGMHFFFFINLYLHICTCVWNTKDVPMEELVLRRNFNDHELKDLTKSLLYYEIRTNAHIFVEKGKPLKPTEFLFQIFVEDEVYKKKKREYDQKKVLEEAKKEVERVKKEKQSKNENNEKTQTTTNEDASTTNTEATGVELPNISTESDLGDAFLFVGNVVLDESWKMAHVKQIIYENIANVIAINKTYLY